MTIYLKDEATSMAVRKLAKLRGTTLTEAVHSAVAEAIAQGDKPKRRDNVLGKLKILQDKIAMIPNTDLEADKAFFDELSGDI